MAEQSVTTGGAAPKGHLWLRAATGVQQQGRLILRLFRVPAKVHRKHFGVMDPLLVLVTVQPLLWPTSAPAQSCGKTPNHKWM